jgi:hypothetical protein
MPPPSTLTIQLVPNSIANVVSIPISSALQTLETSGSGSAADQAVRAIFRAGCFTADGKTWFSSHQVISIVAQ